MSCLYGPGIGSRWDEIFPIDSDRSWGPPSLLYNGDWVSFPEAKRPVPDDHVPQLAPGLEEE